MSGNNLARKMPGPESQKKENEGKEEEKTKQREERVKFLRTESVLTKGAGM